ncbi:non-hydrolyzing UDP-N-acetylglucosamine 2-epimerase [Neopusillimonas maritima]|uniref:UDP-N-acetylglucosamine 2-epimerase (Non-hydrolyzing) n=1 Tax=Neopusillimonas maritima TaxID=2026239 RepID=A0ABX9MWU1_9BURK|nr:UDP-N-acetylglucosamine 2-epimerase (non-hydrolyzing) [Neopusillimonas maritima]
MLIMRVLGARPQFMQEVVFRRAVDARGHRELMVHTGQHYDDKMSRIFFEELGIPQADINLEIGSNSHGIQTGLMLSKLDGLISEYRPDVVVVDGDTNSTLAGALCAAKLNVPVVHVEAGLRSYDRRMPEEINRVVADHLSTLLCAPTRTAIGNLEKEGISENVHLTGDLMFDCFKYFVRNADESIMSALSLAKSEYALATVHRAENTNDISRFEQILKGLSLLPLPVILPAHPRILSNLNLVIDRLSAKNIRVIEPVSYLEMLALELNAKCILTDSGGVQREAYFACVPSVVLRDTTEWIEQVDLGWSVLSGARSQAILEAYSACMNSSKQYVENVYGDGDAASKVVSLMEAMAL